MIRAHECRTAVAADGEATTMTELRIRVVGAIDEVAPRLGRLRQSRRPASLTDACIRTDGI